MGTLPIPNYMLLMISSFFIIKFITQKLHRICFNGNFKNLKEKLSTVGSVSINAHS